MKMVRRGMTVLELVVAAAILGTLLAVSLQLLAATAQQRSVADQRQFAVLEAENMMERLAARPWAELTPQTAVPLSPAVRARLPSAEVKVEVAPAPNDPLAKRIVVALRWRDQTGQFVQPVRIVTWRWQGRDKS
jgi:prepilin-type N-terminal cleavage/methylation domain-containing protein